MVESKRKGMEKKPIDLSVRICSRYLHFQYQGIKGEGCWLSVGFGSFRVNNHVFQ